MLSASHATLVVLLGLVGCGQTRGEVDTAREPTTPDVTDAADNTAGRPRAGGAATAVAPASPAERAPQPTAPPESDVREGQRTVEAGGLPGLAAFVREWPGGGTLWVGRLPGNGGRDVLVFLPAGWAAPGRVQLVFHFHGTHSQQIAAKMPGMKKRAWVGHRRLTQTMEALQQLQSEREGNVALVYPISAGKRREPAWQGWFNKEYDRMWMAPDPARGYADDFNGLHREVMSVLTETLGVAAGLVEDAAIAEGHSAGGIALRNLAEHGTRHIGEYIFLDASFQSWADRCWAAVVRQGTRARVTLVLTDGGMADPFGARDPWCETLPTGAAAWPVAKPWCAAESSRTKQRAPGQSRSCAALETAAEEWPEYQEWCDALADDFAGVDGLTVVRTKVSHGDQPREFSGGLHLPPRP